MEPATELTDYEGVTIAETSLLVVMYAVEAAESTLAHLCEVLQGYAETSGYQDLDLQRAIRDTRRAMGRFNPPTPEEGTS